MALATIHLQKKWLTLYLENNNGLLFNQITHTLYRLDSLSVAIVLFVDDGLLKSDLLAALQKKVMLSEEVFERHYQAVLDMSQQCVNKESYADGVYPELRALTSHANSLLAKTALQPFYQVANSTFYLDGPQHLTQDLHQLLEPIKTETETVDFHLQIKHQNTEYFIYANSLLVEQCQHYAEVIPLVIDRIQILAFQNTDYTFCFHGAALSNPKGNLLLPGESGAGKSTLSALLENIDYQLYSDEIIALDNNFAVAVISLPIAVKTGSWHIVAQKYPEISNQPTWRRIDGRQLRYIWPQNKALAENAVGSKTIIINPKYTERLVATELKEVSVIDTLELLTKSGYQLGFELSKDKLERFIQFIQQSAHYSVVYNDSEDIKKVIESLW